MVGSSLRGELGYSLGVLTRETEGVDVAHPDVPKHSGEGIEG